MSIGYVDILDKGGSCVGCTVRDGPTSCTVDMWDNERGGRIALDMSVTECIKLRNFLNLYIEAYANCIDE